MGDDRWAPTFEPLLRERRNGLKMAQLWTGIEHERPPSVSSFIRQLALPDPPLDRERVMAMLEDAAPLMPDAHPFTYFRDPGPHTEPPVQAVRYQRVQAATKALWERWEAPIMALEPEAFDEVCKKTIGCMCSVWARRQLVYELAVRTSSLEEAEARLSQCITVQ